MPTAVIVRDFTRFKFNRFLFGLILICCFCFLLRNVVLWNDKNTALSFTVTEDALIDGECCQVRTHSVNTSSEKLILAGSNMHPEKMGSKESLASYGDEDGVHVEGVDVTISQRTRAQTTSEIYQHALVSPQRRLQCSEDIRMVIVVFSAAGNEKQREALRRTWTSVSKRRDMMLVFLVGNGGEHTEHSVSNESQLYGDIVHGTFIEAYRNLTLKTIAMLEWLTRYCHRAQMVIKVDDDVFVNEDNLLKFIERHRNSSGVIFGNKQHGWKPHRDPKNKYYVSPEEFPQDSYPDFVTGPCYVITRDLFSRLYQEAVTTPLLSLEDVFLTGIVASKVKARRILHTGFHRSRQLNDCTLKTAISIHKINAVKMYELHYRLRTKKLVCK